MFFLSLAGFFDPEDISFLEGKNVSLEGKVSFISTSMDSGGMERLVITLSGVDLQNNLQDNLPKIKKVLVYMDNGETSYTSAVSGTSAVYEKTRTSEMTVSSPLIGENIKVRGKISVPKRPTNPGGFDGYHYYASKNISFLLYSGKIITRGECYDPYLTALFEFRKKAALIADKVCGNDTGSLRAILLGDKTLLEDEIKDLYQAGGISHILAISALHITFMGGGLYKLLKRTGLRKPAGAVISSFVIISYVLMVGITPSSFRAALMFLISMGADLIGRSYEPLTAMSIAALLLMAQSPVVVTQSGFLLSFGAVIGIFYLYPMLENEWDKPFMKPFLGGISISAITLPILLNTFYSFPLYSFFLNLLVVPLMGGILVCGIIAIMLGFTGVLLPLGTCVFIPARIILFLFRWLCSLSVNLPGGRWIIGKPHWSFIAAYYLLIIAIWFLKDYRCGAGLSLILIACVGIITAPNPEHSGLLVTMLDVGQGDGIVIRTAHNKTIVIDGGSTSNSNIGDKVLLPYLKSQGISIVDYLIITHMDDDHINGWTGILKAQEEGGHKGYDYKEGDYIKADYYENDYKEGDYIKADYNDYDYKDYDYKDYGGFIPKNTLEYMYGSIAYESNPEIKIKNLVLQKIKNPDKEYLDFQNNAKAQGINVGYIGKGDLLKVDGLTFTCLNPRADVYYEDRNDASIVLYMESPEGMSGLFTGDLDKEAEDRFALSLMQELQGRALYPTFLKVGHHGSKYGCKESFLKVIHPEISLISCGAKNRYGHPSPDTIARLKDSGSRVITTPKGGAIIIRPSKGLKSFRVLTYTGSKF